MFSNLTYKKKNKLLLAGTALFLFISYYLAFGRTVSLYNECSSMEEQLESLSDASTQSVILQTKLTQLDQMLGGRELADTNAQQALLNVVSNYCKHSNTVLREFPKSVSKQENEYLVETNVFIVEGNFVKLLQLIYLLEQKERIGKLASIFFQSKQDVRTKALSLTATIYVQNVKKIQDVK